MRAYADSSFILHLIAAEAASPRAVAEYRRTGKPRLFFAPLHALEVRNAIRQRAFHQRRTASANERQNIARERDAALARLEAFLERGTLLETAVDMDTALDRAAEISTAHTERLGARAIDLLHVASALVLKSEMFLTTDGRQARLARSEGLRVVSTSHEA